MRILVTNDDGISAKGIAILVAELARIGEVYVAAPAGNQSSAAHGLTMDVPLRAEETPFSCAKKAWAINGKPADCVKLAMEMLLPFRPDLVVSGINDSPNLGTDVIYSGTVAGALEGFFYQVPAIAISISAARRRSQEGNYQLAAEVAAEYGEKMVAGALPRMMLNINVPGEVREDVKGTRFAPMGWRWYYNAYDRRVDPHGREYFWIQGDREDRKTDGTTDVETAAAGYITVTPLCGDLTDYAVLDELRQRFSE